MTQNLINTDLTLKDLLDLLRRDIMLSLNCHALATVKSFDEDAQTIEAQINYKKSFVQKNQDGTTGTILVDYPILIDVPVISLQGGKGALTFPITKGDSCLIFFNDRDIDNWIFSGQSGQPPATNRLHSFADGIALVGLRDFNNPITNYSADRTELRHDAVPGLPTMVSLKDKIRVKNAVSDFGVAMDIFLTATAAATTAAQIATAAATFKIAFDLLFEVTP